MRSSEGGFETKVLPVLLALGAMSAVWLSRQAPLKESRTPPTPAIRETVGAVRADAPLWADPFLAIESSPESLKRAIDKIPPVSLNTVVARDEFQSVADEAGDQYSQSTRMLVVELPSGSDAVSAERRIRTRYAVVSALLRAGYAPAEPDSIRVTTVINSFLRKITIPYEIFRQDAVDNRAFPSVWVVWTSSDHYRGSGLDKWTSRLTKIFFGLDDARPQGWAIGPLSSDEYIEMLNGRWLADDRSDDSIPPVVLSPWATIPDASLKGYLRPNREIRPPHVLRRVVPDDFVIRTLIQELKTRGFDPVGAGHRLAVICDSDTAYGRALTSTVREEIQAAWPELKRDGVAAEQPRKDRDPLIQYNYLRQLDGVWRGSERDTQASQSSGSSKGESAIERPYGTTQKDYLRRLAAELHATDDGIRNSRPTFRSDARVFAALVLASDPHDKLLIIEAVRAETPWITLATTDLDASLINPPPEACTRNLLVASAFGLTAPPELQGPTPPFRDQYQTAVYACTLEALDFDTQSEGSIDDLMSADMDSPRLYEISRTGTIQLVGPESANVLAPGLRLVKYVLAGCILAAVVAISLALRSCFAERHWTSLHEPHGNRITIEARCCAILLTLFAIGGSVLLVWAGSMLFHYRSDPSSEPFALCDGTSAWVTLLTRCTVGAASGYFVLLMWIQLQKHARETIDQHALAVAYTPALRWWQGLLPFLAAPAVSFSSTGERTINGPLECRRFLEAARIGNRLARTTLLTIIAVLVQMLIMNAFGLDYRSASIRGAAIRDLDMVSGAVVWIAITVMVAFVLDATFLANCGVRWLSKGRTLYRHQTLKRVGNTTGIEHSLAGHYLDIVLVARVGEAVSQLVYVPVALLIVLMLTYSWVFDNWIWWPIVYVSFACNIVLISIAGLLLRFSAEKARGIEIDRLKQKRSMAIQRGNRAAQSAIEEVITRISDISWGSYRPFSQQPFFRVIFYPLGATGVFGIVQLIQSLTQG